jgi:hypothetical protein
VGQDIDSLLDEFAATCRDGQHAKTIVLVSEPPLGPGLPSTPLNRGNSKGGAVSKGRDNARSLAGPGIVPLCCPEGGRRRIYVGKEGVMAADSNEANRLLRRVAQGDRDGRGATVALRLDRRLQGRIDPSAAEVLGLQESADSKRYVRALKRLKAALTGASGANGGF